MPNLKKKDGADFRRTLEKKLHLARESRDEIFDLSECGLSEVPNGIESQVKVFKKSILILHSNSLKKLCTRGRAEDIVNLVHLDLHSNLFTEFPAEIFGMKYLRFLDLSYNQLRSLPDEIGCLLDLSILNVEGNCISTLPRTLSQLRNLKELNLDKNPIEHLPTCLGNLLSLEKLCVPLNSIVFPSRDVCVAGLTAIQNFLTNASGVVDNSLSTVPPRRIQPETTRILDDSLDMIDSSKATREKIWENRSSQRASQFMIDALKAEDGLVSKAIKSRISTLEKLVEDGNRTEAEFKLLQAQRDSRRSELLASLRDAEQHADQLILKLSANKDVVRSQEALWEQAQVDSLLCGSLSFEKLSSQSRRDILDSMKETLLQSQEAVHKYHSSRERNKRSLLSDQVDSDEALKKIIKNRKADCSELALQLSTEEEKQKEAFKRLQADKDLQSRRIIHEIQLVEAELCRLTQAEQERRRKATKVNSSILARQRQKLIDLLTRLRQEKDSRDAELQKRISEMESLKSREQADYWLIQYQRLVDRKPPSLLLNHCEDEDILRVLEAAGASHYAPMFAHHRIKSNMLPSLTDSDLTEIGIHSVGERNAILRVLEDYIAEMKLAYPEPSAPFLGDIVTPTAPPAGKEEFEAEKPLPVDSVASNPQPSAPSILARFESECCVCQDDACSVIFLFCGHVCCCKPCGEKVNQCPICRTTVLQRIDLTETTQ